MGRSGGGSGRSSGGGGGRSSGGRSGGGGRSGRSGFSSGGRSGYSYQSSGGMRHTRYRHGYRGGRQGREPLLFLVVVFILIVTGYLILSGTWRADNAVTMSSVAREPLPKGSVNETDYYTDDIGDWIRSASNLTAGMKSFYAKTGVQPYLFITDNIDGNTNPSVAQVDAWMNELYDDLFTDEAHTLLVFFERNGQYRMWYLNGKQAKTVMDTEAMDILMDYIELYYYSDMSEDEMFSQAYIKAGVRIMEVTKNPIPWYAMFLILLACIGVLLVLFSFWKAKKRQKNIEDENTRAILEAPIEGLSNYSNE